MAGGRTHPGWSIGTGRQPDSSFDSCGKTDMGAEAQRHQGGGRRIAMKEPMAPLAAFAEAAWTRHAHEFEWLVEAVYGAGACREDLLTAVESGQLLGDPPEPVMAEAYATVHAWQWMTNRSPTPSHESAPIAGWRRTQRRQVWIPCTTR